MAEDSRNETPDQRETTGSISRRWLPIASVVGAVGVVTAAVLRPGRPASPEAGQQAGKDAAPQPAAPPGPPRVFPRQYRPVAVLGARGSAGEFRRTLSGVAAARPLDMHAPPAAPGLRARRADEGGEDAGAIYALGDDEVRVFDATGQLARSWKVRERASCLAVGADARVYVGSPGRVDIHDGAGSPIGGFEVGPRDQPADVTSVKVFGDTILVADAARRLIRRYDAKGIERGLVGDRTKTGGFMLPNKSLDFDVGPDGVVYATDSGRHQVSSWTLDGAPIAAFGKFGMTRAEDFVGCCNPVNVAVAPDGRVVTAEKAVARVKVYAPDRALEAVIGTEHFDRMCRHIHLAVDRDGRILAADPERRTITVFVVVDSR